MKLAHIADRIAADIFEPAMLTAPPNSLDRDLTRDACNHATGGELSPRLLDRLADMVEWRLDYLPRKWVDTHPKVSNAVAALHGAQPGNCSPGEPA
jgi:hypothetical protein